VVDATIIATPSSTRNQSGERDPEIPQTKKGKQWHFGMKKVRYKGLAKNTAQLFSLFALANLLIAKRRLSAKIVGQNSCDVRCFGL